MKCSEQWLREWVNPTIDTQTLAEQLTMAGLEVDTVEPAAPAFSGVVVGEVLSAESHPDAKRLHCCQVNIGAKKHLDIVCGGVNVRAGIKVPVAVVGAKLPGDFTIKKAKLRGMPSEGMICSSEELGLGESESHCIMELQPNAPIGEDLRHYLALEDHIIEIELTPNRGDCLSIRGVARDLAVVNAIPLQARQQSPQPVSLQDTLPVSVLAKDACPRYIGRVIRGIDPSALTPIWMLERLRRSGFRAIHPVVDVLNYVMMEIGQPMHAFDLHHLQEKIVVRYAKKGESLTLLDEQVIELSDEELIIADADGPLALAGIMGGLLSGVTSETHDIFLESAFFESIGIRRAASAHALQTDASYRYERGVDANLSIEAMERATELLRDIVGGEAGPVLEHTTPESLPKQRTITFSFSEIKRLLGITLDQGYVEKLLITLGMSLHPANGGWIVEVPSYRFDIEREIDLIEEVARIYGYDRIPAEPMRLPAVIPDSNEAEVSLSRITAFLVGHGYHEAITYSFVSPKMQSLMDPVAITPCLSNPIASDKSVMRSTLWSGLLQAVEYNLNRQQPRVRLFETGLVFRQSRGQCQQLPKLAMIAVGAAHPEQWSAASREVDFYDVKGEVDALLAQTGQGTLFEWRPGRHSALHPGQTAELFFNQQSVGCLGMLHPQVAQGLKLSSAVCCFEVDLSCIQQGCLPQYEAISKFPAVRRDIAVIVDQSISASDLIQTIVQKSDQLLINVEIFDVYEGESMEKNEKSIALGLTFQDSSRTLIDTEINDVIQGVVAILERQFNAKLRA